MATITLKHIVTITYDIGDESPDKAKNALSQLMFAAIHREYNNGTLSGDNITIDFWMTTKGLDHDE